MIINLRLWDTQYIHYPTQQISPFAKPSTSVHISGSHLDIIFLIGLIFYGMSPGIPIIKMRHSWNRLIFIMEIPILVRRQLYIEPVPRMSCHKYGSYGPRLAIDRWSTKIYPEMLCGFWRHVQRSLKVRVDLILCVNIVRSALTDSL